MRRYFYLHIRDYNKEYLKLIKIKVWSNFPCKGKKTIEKFIECNDSFEGYNNINVTHH